MALRCPNCDAVIPAGEVAGGWCESCGKKLPPSLAPSLPVKGEPEPPTEGGGVTVSRFVAAGAVDRLHLVIAPVLVGAGRPGLCLPEPLASTLDDCPRPPTRTFPLGRDLLIDCSLR